jgi:hypothetical protein
MIAAAATSREGTMSLEFMRSVRAPELPDGLDWIGSRPLRLSELRGKFVLLDFWTFG